MASKYGKKGDFRTDRESLKKEISGMVKATKELTGPLKTLDKDQIAAVTFLVLERDILMRASRKSAGLDEDLILSFKAAVESICPDFEPILELSRFKDPCMEHEVAYVSALAKCEKDGRDEDECHEAWGPGAAAVLCTMKQIEDMKGHMIDIWEGFRGPRPFPWPVEPL